VANGQTRQVNVPGVGPVAFPISMTDEQVVQAIERDILPSQKVVTAGPATGISAYRPSLAERLKSMVTEAIPRTSTKTVHDPTYGQMQLLQPEAAMTPLERERHPVLTGAGEFAGSMTGPENVALLAASGGLGGLPGAAGRILPRLMSGVFSSQMLWNAYQNIAPFKEAVDRGDMSEAKRIITHIVLSAGTAGLASKAALPVRGAKPAVAPPKVATPMELLTGGERRPMTITGEGFPPWPKVVKGKVDAFSRLFLEREAAKAQPRAMAASAGAAAAPSTAAPARIPPPPTEPPPVAPAAPAPITPSHPSWDAARDITENILREAQALTVRHTRVVENVKDIERGRSWMRSLPAAVQEEWQYRLDEGQPPPVTDPRAAHYEHVMRTILKHDERMLAQEGLLHTFIDDYFPRRHGQPSLVQRAIYALRGRAPVRGSGGFLKPRAVDPATGQRRSYREMTRYMGTKPRELSPLEAVLAHHAEATRYIMFNRALKELRGRGLVATFDNPHMRPEGWERLDTEVMGGAPNQYAPAGTARALNAVASRSILPGQAFEAIRWMNNLGAQVAVSASGYHFWLTSTEAIATELELAIQRGKLAQPGKASMHLLKGVSGVYPMIDVFNLGKRGAQEYLRPGTQNPHIRYLVGKLLKGGYQFEPAWWRNNAIRSFQDALKRHSGTAVYKAIPAALETLSWPIMRWWVPRIKMAAALKMAELELEKLGPDASEDAVHASMARVVDAVDDRFGQLTHDNLFWRSSTRQALAMTFKFVGFNFGTIRAMAGDIPRAVAAARLPGGKKPLRMAAKKTVAGDVYELARGGDLSPRLSHIIAWLFMYMTGNFVAQTVMTGKPPWETDTPWLDAFMARTGKVGLDGKPDRVLFPSYFRSAYEFGHPVVTAVKGHPATAAGEMVQAMRGRTSTLFNLVNETLQNKDFYGRELAHEGDPLWKRLQDYSERVLADQGLPISWRIMQEARKRGEPVWPSLLFGMSRPAARMLRSKAEEKLYQVRERHRTAGPVTEAEFEQRQASNELLRRLQSKQAGSNDIFVAWNTGKISTNDMHRLLRHWQDTNPWHSLRGRDVTPQEVLDVWKDADPAERKKIGSTTLWLKRKSIYRTIPPGPEQQRLLREFDEAIREAPPVQ
jgi:hypothetical protein